MPDENQRNRYRTKPVQRGNAAAPFRLIPDCQPADTAYRSNPSGPPSRTRRSGVRPARLSARCLRALTTLSPGAVVAADTSLPLLLIRASLEATQPDRPKTREDTQRLSCVGLCYCYAWLTDRPAAWQLVPEARRP